MSSLWTNLLFMHGHIADLDLARRLANAPKPSERPTGKRQRKAKTIAKRSASEALPQSGCVTT